MSTLAWIGIGIGIVVLIVFVVAIRAYPDDGSF
jgi:hypothetical protein